VPVQETQLYMLRRSLYPRRPVQPSRTHPQATVEHQTRAETCDSAPPDFKVLAAQRFHPGKRPALDQQVLNSLPLSLLYRFVTLCRADSAV
jgi:hypothetical protein